MWYLCICTYLYTYAYITTRSLTVVLLYPYHIDKSVSAGTDLIIILKNHSQIIKFYTLAYNRFPMSGYEHM